MQIIPIASGKGGVGKSLLAANLAVALGQMGRRVVLADMDLGASNLHLALGQKTGGESLGSWLTDKTSFLSIITPTEYPGVSFIAGDSQIPGLTSLRAAQKTKLVRSFNNLDADFLVLDLGAGTHQIILDMFLLSPQGVVVSAPTVTATLNGYIFLKNAVFRLMYTTFRKGSPGYDCLEKLRRDSEQLKKLYVPNLIKTLQDADPERAQLFITRLRAFRPRLVMNMIDNPKDAEKAQRIRKSCEQYLGMDIEYVGALYRDNLQDKALASGLPIVVYKRQSVLSQAIFRIADKIVSSPVRSFDSAFAEENNAGSDSFQVASEEASEDFDYRLQGIEDMVGSGTLNVGELAEVIRTQQFELTKLKNENNLLKSKLVKAASQGFKL